MREQQPGKLTASSSRETRAKSTFVASQICVFQRNKVNDHALIAGATEESLSQTPRLCELQ